MDMLNVAVLWLGDVCNPVMFTHANMKNDFNKKLKLVSEILFIMTFTKKCSPSVSTEKQLLH